MLNQNKGHRMVKSETPRPSFKIQARDLTISFKSEPETPPFKNPSPRRCDVEIRARQRSRGPEIRARDFSS